ncbi:MAG TPA: cation-translocating P-type ATPase C-terminal domain-containing protein, partial [Methylomicrobium sp.]|nr:cation-translocating P-type ATPase C-terminal domain-containing protein [Methylomicrobium sp.]
VSLILIQFIMAYNYRSDRFSALNKPFANKWLNMAVAWELIPLAAILYLPAMHEPFFTFSLSHADWAVVILPALTVFPFMELSKWMVRRGWFGESD